MTDMHWPTPITGTVFCLMNRILHIFISTSIPLHMHPLLWILMSTLCLNLLRCPNKTRIYSDTTNLHYNADSSLAVSEVSNASRHAKKPPLPYIGICNRLINLWLQVVTQMCLLSHWFERYLYKMYTSNVKWWLFSMGMPIHLLH